MSDDNVVFSGRDAITSFGQVAASPHPAFDYLTGFAPRRLRDVMKWAEYLFYNSAHTFAALRKFGELSVTEIEFATSNAALKKKYKKLYEQQIKMKSVLLMASLDRHVYGNHFTSLFQPFIRFLKCANCTHLTNITTVNYKFDLKTLGFKYTCKKCRNATSGQVVDRKMVDATKLHVIRWDPKQIDLEYNPISGMSVIYYNIPTDVKDKVKQGSKHLINSMPMEFLETIRDNKLFRFEDDAVFHLKVPGPAGIDAQWGFPPLASCIKLFLYTMLLKKANEAVSMEHILPMRILHPAQHGSQDITQVLSYGKWQSETSNNIRRWRRDPLHVMFSPVPLGISNMGGDGRAMLTLGEVQEADRSIMMALGIPPEILSGDITKAGMEAKLRLIENQTQGHTDSLNDLLTWLTNKLSKYMGWETIEAQLLPMKMVDDTETKAMINSLATQQPNGPPPIVSQSTLMERLGLDLAQEREKRKQEAIDEARLQMEIQREQAKLQNTLSEQVQQQVTNAAGTNYEPQAVVAQADQMVQQLSGLDPGTRRSQLHQLQIDDFVLYSVVIQRLEMQDTAQTQQAKVQMTGGQ